MGRKQRMPTPSQPADAAGKVNARKSCETPVLIEWGTLNDSTRAAGSRGKSDHGGNPYNKTSV
jgi:hypothetical protein